MERAELLTVLVTSAAKLLLTSPGRQHSKLLTEFNNYPNSLAWCVLCPRLAVSHFNYSCCKTHQPPTKTTHQGPAIFNTSLPGAACVKRHFPQLVSLKHIHGWWWWLCVSELMAIARREACEQARREKARGPRLLGGPWGADKLYSTEMPRNDCSLL